MPSPPDAVSEVAWQTVTQLVEQWQRRPESFGGLQEAAAHAGYEPTHFAKLFRAVVGVPPAAYVRSLRLERAALRLEDAGARVDEVAHEAGYGSPEAFTRAFTRRYGQSPSAFRSSPPMEAPEACPELLDWAGHAVVDRSFVGWGLPCTPEPDSMGPAMEAVRLDGAAPDSLGALSQPWGWSHMAGQPDFVAVQLTDRRPVPPPVWPVWIPERPWLRVDWTGPTWEVGAAIVWIHAHGLGQLGRQSGFAPTLSLFRDDGSLRVWIPLRAS